MNDQFNLSPWVNCQGAIPSIARLNRTAGGGLELLLLTSDFKLWSQFVSGQEVASQRKVYKCLNLCAACPRGLPTRCFPSVQFTKLLRSLN
jgi:hypothetical protein